MNGKGFQPGALWFFVFLEVDFPPTTMEMKIIIENKKSKGEKKPQGTHALQQLPTVHL